MRPRHLLPIALPLVGLAIACEALVGIEDHRFAVPAPPDVVDPCLRLEPPPRPDGMVQEPAYPTYVFAWSSVDLAATLPDGTPVGFDLDETCTCSPLVGARNDGGFSCTPPGDPQQKCDFDAGIDNALAGIMQQIQPLVGLLGADDLDQPLRCGGSTVLILLHDYNGRPNDPEVQLQLIESTGIAEKRDDDSQEKVEAMGCGFDTEHTSWPPRHDGKDAWSTPLGIVTDTSSPRIYARAPFFSGWVSNYQLILDRRDGDLLPLYVFSHYFAVSRPRLVAKMTPLDADGRELPLAPDGTVASGERPAGFALDGMAGGRGTPKDLLTAVGNARFPGDRFLCDHPELYEPAKGIICGALDTKLAPREDFLPGPCDALSLGIRFGARSARLGPPRDRNPTSTHHCEASHFSYGCD